MPDIPVHLLYIDDDATLVRLIEKAAQRRGYGLTHAQSVSEGIEQLAQFEPSLIVLDHNLGDGTGLLFLKELETVDAAPPVIYVTGSTETAIAVNALKAGAYDYVSKTADGNFLELLFNAIESALERSRLNRARLRAEQEMREARERAELLLSEVNHRVANSLALVASLVRMQGSLVKDTAAAHALNETEGRIKAISGVHRRLYRSTDIGKIALDEYLSDLVSDLASSIAADGRKNIIEFEGNSICVSPDKAVSIGVAVTELVTNAVKYAYSDQSAGRVLVTLSLLPDSQATVSVIDEGKGWDGTGVVQGTGLGTRIVKAMMTSLKTKLVYAPRPVGTEASFEFET